MITFLRFGRAHTLIGTTLSLVALYLMAARQSGAHDLSLLLDSLIVCLAANVYITGLNQLTDVEIDRINKPYLPLASGAYSVSTGRAIVGVCLVVALYGCFDYTPFFPAMVLGSILLGTAYSVEPIRLKRFHFWAAFCIIVVRGLIINLLGYLHFAYQLSGEVARPQVPWTLVMLTVIIFVFGVIIAWFKDLPDTVGDERYGIKTFTLVRSREYVYRTGSVLLGATLLVAGVAALQVGWLPLGICLLGLLVAFVLNTRLLDLREQSSIARFYQGTWVIFFGVYLTFALFG